MAIRSIRIHYESITNYITHPPVQSVQNVLLGSLSNPKKCHLCIKVAESAIPHRIFWLLWEAAYTLTKWTEMTVAGIWLVLCAVAALEIEEEKKERRRSETTSASKKKKKSEGLVEKKSPTGTQHDFAIRTGGRRYCQLQELPQNGPRYI